MKQKEKKIQYEFKKALGTFSPFGGVAIISEALSALGLSKVIDDSIGIGERKAKQAIADHLHIESIMAMQCIGGGSVDGLSLIRRDEVLKSFLGGRIPSKSAAHSFLSEFDDLTQECLRGQGRSFVPTPNEHLKGFDAVTKHILFARSRHKPKSTVTLDQDATFINTGVNRALYNYKKERSFEAFNTYCHDYDMMVHSEYRDGNVSPGFNQLECLKRALTLLPPCVREVRLRSDSAGYQTELLKYCAQGENERFGRIEFAVSSPVTHCLKAAAKAASAKEWRPVTGKQYQECANINFVPTNLCRSKNTPEYRFIAIREEIDAQDPQNAQVLQASLFTEEELGELPFKALHPTEMGGRGYKLFAIVTNILDKSPEEIVEWQRGRCGRSEQIHHTLKDELAGGHVVTDTIGANAAWWQITVLAANILSFIRNVLLPKKYSTARPKRMRFELFSAAARKVSHAGRTKIVIYLTEASGLLEEALKRLKRQKPLLE